MTHIRLCRKCGFVVEYKINERKVIDLTKTSLFIQCPKCGNKIRLYEK